MKSPILLLIFNRPDTTAKVFAAIRKAQPSVLYLAADGPKKENAEDQIKCKETRELVMNQIDWPCKVKTLCQRREPWLSNSSELRHRLVLY